MGTRYYRIIIKYFDEQGEEQLYSVDFHKEDITDKEIISHMYDLVNKLRAEENSVFYYSWQEIDEDNYRWWTH